MRLDLHVHSCYSDGRDGVYRILKYATLRGLDGIALTDHDTLKGSAAAKRLIHERKLDIILVAGAEISTSEGHLLALGINELPPPGKSPEETVELVHDLGGIAIVPHPYHLFRHALFRIPECDAVEVYNSKHFFGISNALARQVARRRGLPVVAGSDAHVAEAVGLGVTEIEATSADDILDAICRGRTKIIGRRTPPSIFLSQIVRRARRVRKRDFRAGL